MKNRWKYGIIKEEFIFSQPKFVMCHAANIIETSDGLVAVWFAGLREGGHTCIQMSYYIEDHWAFPVTIVEAGNNCCWNPVLCEINGKLILFYKVGSHPTNWIGFMKTSKDNGDSWSKAKKLPKGYLGPTKNKPILGEDGLILIPSSVENNDRSWSSHVEWATSNLKMIGMSKLIGLAHNAIQPTILKLGNLFWMLCRSRSGFITESLSSDGINWAPMTKTSLPNPNSGIDAITLQDRRQLLVYNHTTRGRSSLNVSIYNKGDWHAALILEEGYGNVSYPSVIQSRDGHVHIVYTWNRVGIKYIEIDLSKIRLTKIKNGKWPGRKKL